MINTLSILFSLAAVGFVVIRAAALDRAMPWFQASRPDHAERPGRPDPAPP